MSGGLAFDDGKPCGVLRVTPGVEALGINLAPLLRRHLSRDWGEVDEHDRAANDASYAAGAGAHSAYTVNGTKIWIITDAGHGATTVLLPDEY